MRNTIDSYHVRYAPKSLAEVVYPSAALQQHIASIAAGDSYSNLLFYGPSHTGKTTVAQLLATTLWGTQLNQPVRIGPDQYEEYPGIKLIKVIDNAVAMMFVDHPVVVLEELDNFKKPKLLTDMFDRVKHLGWHWIATTNHINQIDPALRTRLTPIDWSFNTIDPFIPRITHILQAELAADLVPDEQLIRLSFTHMMGNDPTINLARLLDGVEQIVNKQRGVINNLRRI